MSTSPEGLIKLEINHSEPNDSGAYKLVISNPHGEKIALCAVAVKRNYQNNLIFKYTRGLRPHIFSFCF